MNKIFSLILLLVLSAYYSALNAEFGNGLEQGARQQALGEAFTGLADDGEGVFYNQAGLVNLQKIEFMSSYSRQLSGLTGDLGVNVNYIGYAQNLGSKYGAIAAKWFYRGYSDGDVFGANENIFLLGYGRTLLDIPYLNMIPGFKNNPYIQELSVGLGLKIMRWEISDNDGMSYFAGESDYSSWTTGLDMSIFYRMNDRISLGAVAKDMIYIDDNEDGYEKAPYSGHFGGAWKYNPNNLDDVITMDIVREDRRYSLNMGSERYFDFKYGNNEDRIVARGGMQLGFDDYYSFALGFGYLVPEFAKRMDISKNGGFPFDLRFDYTLKMQLGELDESPLNHSLQLNFFIPQGKEKVKEGIFVPVDKPKDFIEVESKDSETKAKEELISDEVKAEFVGSKVQIIDIKCKIYASPDLDSDMIFEVQYGENGIIRDMSGDFFKVEILTESEGTIYGGWIKKESLKVTTKVETIEKKDSKEDIQETVPVKTVVPAETKEGDNATPVIDKKEQIKQEESSWFDRYFIIPIKKLFGADEESESNGADNNKSESDNSEQDLDTEKGDI